jgi:RNA polymerase sigma-70 factor, ECF subfamily
MSYRIACNSEEAEEVVLEVFMYLWKCASQYDPELSKPLTWLLMITRSRAIDKIRKSARAVQIDDGADENFVTDTQSPEDTYISSERRTILRSAMSQLTDKQKKVVELSYYQQFSHSEISERVGIPVGSVKSTIRVAMVKLKNIIKAEQGRLYAAEVH